MDANKIEHKTDSLLFVLASKPWTALFLIGVAVGLFAAGVAVGANVG